MNLLLSVLFGVAQSLCIPPLPLGPLIPLVLAGMLVWVDSDSPRQALRKGFLSGFVLQVATLHWIRSVMQVGPALTIGIGLVLLFAYLSAFQALWCWLWVHCRRLSIPWVWPILFCGIELLRGMGQMAFPWNHVAYDLGLWLPGLQGVAWTGVYGTGLLVAATAAILALWARRALPRWTVILPLVFWGFWWGLGYLRLQTAPFPTAMRVAVVQPAIPQTKKWDESYFQAVMQKTRSVAGRIQERPDLWAFPETAIPDLWSWRPTEVDSFQHLASRSRAPVLVGALEYLYPPPPIPPDRGKLRNSAFLIPPGGRAIRYDKLRLVPFSEHLPFDDLLPALNQVKLGQSGFSAGEKLPVWNTGMAWSPAICFEMVHADFPRAAVAQGAKAVVVITNDGWFGNSLGPRQHWNIHRFHSVENGLAMVRSANTGISGATDHLGRILAKSRLMQDTAFIVGVPEGPGSFYCCYGVAVDLLLRLLSFAGAGWFAFSLVRARRNAAATGSPRR